jgi:hypothetical protein
MLKLIAALAFAMALLASGDMAVAQQSGAKKSGKCIDHRAICFKKCEEQGGRACAVLCNSRPTCG